MTTIAKLFARSPFGPLQRHMQHVGRCITKMNECLESFQSGEWERIEELAAEVSRLEHGADKIKEDIRSQTLRRFFMPIAREHVFYMLSTQDSLADTAEDVAVLLTIRQIAFPDLLSGDFREFCELNITAFSQVCSIVDALDELFETGFGGAEAEKIRTMVHEVAFSEHQVDVKQRSLLRMAFGDEANLGAADLQLWMQLIKHISRISNLSENLANRIQMTLDIK